MGLARDFLIYGVAGAASRLAAVVLVPLYTRALSVDAYGELEVLLSIHALLVILSGMQSESAVARDYFAAKDEGRLKELIWGALVATFGGTGLVSVVTLSAGAVGWLPPRAVESLPLLLPMTLLAQLLGVQMVLLRFAGAPVLFAILSFVDLALCALLSAWFIVGFGLGVTGALGGLLASKAVCVLLAWGSTFGCPPAAALATARLRSMLSYAVPSIPAVLLNWLQNAGNRVLLAATLTLSDVAIAGVATKVAALYGFVIYSFRLAWEPYGLAKLPTLAEDPGVFNRALQWYAISMLAAGGLVTVASPTIVGLLAPATYAAGGQLAAFFVAGQFWTGAISILSIGIHGARITGKLFHVYCLGALINTLVLYLLGRAFGVTVAGVAFLAGSVASALLANYFSERHYRTGFSWKLLLWSLLASVLFASAMQWLQQLLLAERATTYHPLAYIAAGLTLLCCMLALVIWRGLEPGRAGMMWTQVQRQVRSRFSPV